MLSQLHIKNFTIIDELDLDLQPGMTVVTGETGAGKSIMIDAIELALGKRVNNDVVRQGTDRADISITFDLKNIPQAQTLLKELELDSDHSCLIRRTISKDGRSKNFINGTPVTQQTLRSLSDTLINIHGQHEFQTLLNRKQQLSLLDGFAHHQNLIDDVNSLFHQWKKAKANYETLFDSLKDATDREAFLTYQLKELHDLSLSENEIEKITKEHQQLANADTLLNNCQLAITTIDNDETSASLLLNHAQQSIADIQELDDGIKNAFELINNAIIHAEEAKNELRDFLNRLEINPERLVYLEERLNKIHELARKHRIEPEELLTLQADMEKELNAIEHRDESLQALKENYLMLEKNYFTAAKKLTSSRKKSAKQLEKSVTDNMQLLNMNGGQFKIEFETYDDKLPHANGIERITFLVSTNAGQPFGPLNKIASGGELSRISLAIQVITAQHSETPTLVFDEVDIGIGGKTADIVGALLRELGESTQTLCITHLPQVAAKGHHHLNVTKITKDNMTFATINYLDIENRTQEIARMSGGTKITKQTLAHAKEMLDI